MGMLARRYRGKVGSWELWNEPDNRDYWRGTAAQFADLLVAGARAVRAADPAAKVVFGGIAGHPAFAAEVMARPELAGLIDVVNTHAYFETWNPDPIETPAALSRRLRSAGARRGAVAVVGRGRLQQLPRGGRRCRRTFRRGSRTSTRCRSRRSRW